MLTLMEQITELLRRGECGVVATVVETRGSVPQVAGARMLMFPDGRILGTVGGGALEHQVRALGPQVLAEGTARLLTFDLGGDLGMACGGGATVFLEALGREDRLYLFGAGHIAEQICEMASRCGFAVTVCDARDELRTRERFPAARALSPVCAPERLGELPLASHAEDAYVMVVTHGHALDFALVRALLVLDLAYLGMIGSKAKAAKLRQELKAEGVPQELTGRVQSPAGLPIGGRSPAEIALSIVAELVQRRSQRADRGPSSAAKGAPATRDAGHVREEGAPGGRGTDGSTGPGR